MKASELIKELQAAVEECGDLDILVRSPADGWDASLITVWPDPPSKWEKQAGVEGTIDITAVERDDDIARRNDLLWDTLADHWGHKVEIALYGDPDAPVSVTLEDMDTNTVILDAELYTLLERTDA